MKIDTPWHELAYQDLKHFWGKPPTEADVNSRVEFYKDVVEDLQLGMFYAYLDGAILPVTARNICFDGIHRTHSFNFVPHLKAATSPEVIERYLGNRQYWEHERVEDD